MSGLKPRAVKYAIARYLAKQIPKDLSDIAEGVEGNIHVLTQKSEGSEFMFVVHTSLESRFYRVAVQEVLNNAGI